VVNADDPNAEKFAQLIPNSISYGIGTGDLSASNLDMAIDHSTFKATFCNAEYNIKVNIPGMFNVSNALATIAVGRELRLSKKQIEQGIVALDGVEGRMTFIDQGQEYKVIVDFANTPDGYEKLFASLRPVVKGKLVAMFGSPGSRDEAKRPMQGEIAGRYCDEVILTEDDCRDTDCDEIMQQIADGAKQACKVVDKDLFLIPFREKAIRFALSRVKNADDAVLFLGKGHEKTILRVDGEHPWNEIQTVKDTINSLK
jgi:UDP-N-acetylmuramoyl-L-alanyl-D-glutamate--2,6-diaminopimelate ligase